MGKATAQMLEQPTNLTIVNFQKNSDVNFSTLPDGREQTIAEKISERITVNARFSRLRRRMRNRSSNIL